MDMEKRRQEEIGLKQRPVSGPHEHTGISADERKGIAVTCGLGLIHC